MYMEDKQVRSYIQRELKGLRQMAKDGHDKDSITFKNSMLRSIYNRLDALSNFIETVNDEDIKYTK